MSPIKGMTIGAKAAFPTVGKLRKGAPMSKDQNGKPRIGPDLQYFRFTSERPEVQAAFEAVYGDKPTLINVFLPHATVEECFDCWREEWVAGGLVHRCDGETAVLWRTPQGTFSREPKPCPGGCKPVGRLNVWIPELVDAGFIGYVLLETHGINDVVSIQRSLLAGLEARGDNPKGLVGIKWSLRRVEETISTPGQDGKRARRKKWLVKLEPAPEWVRLQLRAAEAQAMLMPGQPAQLPPGVDEDGVITGGAVPTEAPEGFADGFEDGEFTETEPEQAESAGESPEAYTADEIGARKALEED